MSIILLIDQQNPTSVYAREGFSIKFGNLMSIFVILVLVCAFKHVCVCASISCLQIIHSWPLPSTLPNSREPTVRETELHGSNE